jgi:hypothetical protein
MKIVSDVGQAMPHRLSEPSPQNNFAPWSTFRECVLNDPVLLARLRAMEDGPAFANACVAAAREIGIVLSSEDVESALATARREWIERWVQ